MVVYYADDPPLISIFISPLLRMLHRDVAERRPLERSTSGALPYKYLGWMPEQLDYTKISFRLMRLVTGIPGLNHEMSRKSEMTPSTMVPVRL